MQISQREGKLEANFAHYSAALNEHKQGQHFLSHLLTEIPGYIYLKTASDLKYAHCNKKLLELFSLNETRDILNKTNQDVKNKLASKSLSRFFDSLDNLEKNTVNNKVGYKEVISEPFLDSNGQVRQLSLTLSPILSECKKEVVSILFYGHDITSLKPHDELHSSYNYLYEDKKQGLIKFFEHIGFSTHIDKTCNITRREFEILLVLAHGKTSKEVGNKLNISSRTVETHLDRIKQKMNARNKLEVMRKFLSHYKA